MSIKISAANNFNRRCQKLEKMILDPVPHLTFSIRRRVKNFKMIFNVDLFLFYQDYILRLKSIIKQLLKTFYTTPN